MTELYFGFKFWGSVVFYGCLALLFIVLIIRFIIENIKAGRKRRLLLKSGYEEYLHSVASVGGGCTYGWRRPDKPYRCIRDYEIRNMSYKNLKQWIKDAE